MNTRGFLWLALLVMPALIVGCNSATPPSGAPEKNTGKNPEAEKYLLAAEPANAQGVKQLREKAKDGDAVVIVGRVGGSKEPCVKGRVAFTIVDALYLSCDENQENCDTPWDYCHVATDELLRATALVKLVDSRGKTIAIDAKDFLGIEPLQTVVIQGRAKRDETGNLTVLAEGIFIRPKKR